MFVVPLYAIDLTETLLLDVVTSIGVPVDVPGAISSTAVIGELGREVNFTLSAALITPAEEAVATFIVPFAPSDELTTTFEALWVVVMFVVTLLTLLLKVLQSVEDKNPLELAEACVILKVKLLALLAPPDRGALVAMLTVPDPEPALPFAAAVILPNASTEMFAFV